MGYFEKSVRIYALRFRKEIRTQIFADKRVKREISWFIGALVHRVLRFLCTASEYERDRKSYIFHAKMG